MSNVIFPPVRRFKPAGNISVFLAGSIDNGKAEDWQSIVSEQFAGSSVVTIYNPRRTDWDWTWEQKLENDQFVDQVNWELDFLDNADFIFMFFGGATKSPISLLEFGRITAKYPGKLVICCEPEFWRRGNIEVICNREGIELHEDLKGAMIELSKRVAHRVQATIR